MNLNDLYIAALSLNRIKYPGFAIHNICKYLIEDKMDDVVEKLDMVMNKPYDKETHEILDENIRLVGRVAIDLRNRVHNRENRFFVIRPGQSVKYRDIHAHVDGTGMYGTTVIGLMTDKINSHGKRYRVISYFDNERQRKQHQVNTMLKKVDDD